jgi:hypothetical protein
MHVGWFSRELYPVRERVTPGQCHVAYLNEQRGMEDVPICLWLAQFFAIKYLTTTGDV